MKPLTAVELEILRRNEGKPSLFLPQAARDWNNTFRMLSKWPDEELNSVGFYCEESVANLTGGMLLSYRAPNFAK